MAIIIMMVDDEDDRMMFTEAVEDAHLTCGRANRLSCQFVMARLARQD